MPRSGVLAANLTESNVIGIVGPVEAGDAKLAAAYIEVAKLLYRNEWTKTKSDPVALNAEIESAIAAGGYPELDPAAASPESPVS